MTPLICFSASRVLRSPGLFEKKGKKPQFDLRNSAINVYSKHFEEGLLSLICFYL